MSDLPADVIADILSRLPVKPLLRLRCVSKPWRALIDSPDFVKMHLNRSVETMTNLSVILRGRELYSVNFDSLDRAIKLRSPLKSGKAPLELLGSCNGLLCLSNTEKDIVFLFNPSTQQHRKLPVTPIESSNCDFIVYGFGYDAVNDDYKVVRMIRFGGEKNDAFDSEVKVYSLKSNSWRRIQDFPFCVRYREVSGILAHGALHWVVNLTPPEPESDASNLIAAFDIGVGEYGLVPQPEYSDMNFFMNLEVLGGCLCVVCTYVLSHVDIWVMKEYGVKESWTKLLTVEQPSVIRHFCYVRPIAYSKGGREVLLEQDHKRLLWYDLKRKKVRRVRLCNAPKEFEADISLESLVQLCGDGGNDAN